MGLRDYAAIFRRAGLLLIAASLVACKPAHADDTTIIMGNALHPLYHVPEQCHAAWRSGKEEASCSPGDHALSRA